MKIIKLWIVSGVGGGVRKEASTMSWSERGITCVMWLPFRPHSQQREWESEMTRFFVAREITSQASGRIRRAEGAGSGSEIVGNKPMVEGRSAMAINN